jgi:vacuolar-type H+-ATPase subunit H
MKEAEVKAREKGVEIMAKVVEQTQYKAISVARDMTLNRAEEIINEAEQRAKQIIEEAERMAEYMGEGTPESKRSQTHRNRFLRLFKSS